MFPVRDAKLSLGDISNYWSRQIQPQASQTELLSTLMGAFWVGEIGGFPISRFDLLKQMFRSMYGRNGATLVFVTRQQQGPPQVTELPDGSADIDLRPRITVPSSNPEDWTEDACAPAFHALTQMKTMEEYGQFAPVLFGLELSYESFRSWLRIRGYTVPSFWRPEARLTQPKRGRPPTYNWLAVKSKLEVYVSQHGPVQTRDELLQKCADFATDLHPDGGITPSDKAIGQAILRHQLDLTAGAGRRK